MMAKDPCRQPLIVGTCGFVVVIIVEMVRITITFSHFVLIHVLV